MNSIKRRTVLRGLGTAIALPMMESLLGSAHASALGSASFSSAAPAKRLAVFYFPNGMRMDQFTPASSGADYAMTPILKPLESYRDRFSVVTGLGHNNAKPLGDPGGAHGRSCAAFLTGAHPKPTEGSDLYCGISMDQFVANRIGQDNPFTSLELGIEPSTTLGSCDIGFSCTYTNTLSWRSPTQALPVTVNPRDLFERLFGEGASLDEESRQALLKRKASILDFVMEDAARLSRNLGINDQRKLDEYMQSIRDVERRIEKSSAQPIDLDATGMTLPVGIPDSFEEHTRLMIDLQILAMQTDMTRVTTFMLGRDLSNRAYSEIGVPDSHHSLSHHGGNEQKIAKLVKISTLHMQQFAYYLKRMTETRDGEGSLLDSTLVMAGASLGEPNAHDCMDLPAILAGGGISGNRHIAVQKETPFSNLMLSMIQQLGIPAESFGDSNGTLSELSTSLS